MNSQSAHEASREAGGATGSPENLPHILTAYLGFTAAGPGRPGEGRFLSADGRTQVAVSTGDDETVYISAVYPGGFEYEITLSDGTPINLAVATVQAVRRDREGGR